VVTEANIVEMARNQVPEGGVVLGRAFMDDPMMVFALPDEAETPASDTARDDRYDALRHAKRQR
jgi:hypothetical protein